MNDEIARLKNLLASVIETTRWIQFLEAGLQVVYEVNKDDLTGRLPLYMKLKDGDKYTGEDLKIEKLKATARLLRSIDYAEGFSPVKAEEPDEAEMNRLAHEALYPEERAADCPYCGRRREIPEERGGRLIMRCAFCDFGTVNVTEDDEDYDDDIPLTRQDLDDLHEDLMNEWIEPPDDDNVFI